MTGSGGGAGLRPLERNGVSGNGVSGTGFRAVGEHRFDRPHPAAATLDEVAPAPFRRAVGRLAIPGPAPAARPGRRPRGTLPTRRAPSVGHRPSGTVR